MTFKKDFFFPLIKNEGNLQVQGWVLLFFKSPQKLLVPKSIFQQLLPKITYYRRPAFQKKDLKTFFYASFTCLVCFLLVLCVWFCCFFSLNFFFTFFCIPNGRDPRDKSCEEGHEISKLAKNPCFCQCKTLHQHIETVETCLNCS